MVGIILSSYVGVRTVQNSGTESNRGETRTKTVFMEQRAQSLPGRTSRTFSKSRIRSAAFTISLPSPSTRPQGVSVASESSAGLAFRSPSPIPPATTQSSLATGTSLITRYVFELPFSPSNFYFYFLKIMKKKCWKPGSGR